MALGRNASAFRPSAFLLYDFMFYVIAHPKMITMPLPA